MKFDIYIANPPYRGTEKFLNEMNRLTDGEGVALTPTGWWRRIGGPIVNYTVEKIESISTEDFRKLFETRNETDLGIFKFHKSLDNIEPPNKDVKKPKIAIKDKIVSYTGQPSFLVLGLNCIEDKSPVRYGIHNKKFFKLYTNSLGEDGEDILDIVNKRRKRKGLEPKDTVICKGLEAKDKDDIIRLKYLVEQEYEKTKNYIGRGFTGYLFDCMEYR
jgi:uncharacterized protein YdcH (DUF465 family)